MNHCTGKCHQGRKPCRCWSPDTPHVPLVVTLALWMFIAFSVLAFVATI